MKAVRAVALFILIGAAVAGSYYYFNRPVNPSLVEGWVEADMIFVSPDEIGRIETLSVREGAKVKVGSPLFTLDDELQRAAVAENEAYVANAEVGYKRAQELLKRAVGSEKAFDDAKAELRSAEAKLNSANTRLSRRSRTSPVAGSVEEIYFRGGELVEPGRPIVSILPPGNVKIRFFVPQALLPTIHIGDRVHITCDGCADDLYGRVSFISAQAEYTPPVIYSLDERARLVFRIEALPDEPQKLRIGQPVSVELQEQPAKVTHADKQ